ncbi:hypothetical protein, partial [Aeromonas sp.]|uniref:hypothetical protein n=1 Tax=Aeromonas sp. TaxID=647 RepID=UPI002584E263
MKKPKRVTAWAFSLNMAEEVPAATKSNSARANTSIHLISSTYKQNKSNPFQSDITTAYAWWH